MKIEKDAIYILRKKLHYIHHDIVFKVKILEETEKTIYYHNLDNDIKIRNSKDFFEREFEIIEKL